MGPALAIVHEAGGEWWAESPDAPGWKVRAPDYLTLAGMVEDTLPGQAGLEGTRIVYDASAARALAEAVAGWRPAGDQAATRAMPPPEWGDPGKELDEGDYAGWRADPKRRARGRGSRR